MDQKSYEHNIGEGLCLKLGDGWRIVGQPDPPAPDLLLQSDQGETVAVELARYRQQGRENEQHKADWRFRHAVCDAWIADDAVNETSLNLLYALASSGRYRIPLPSDQPRVIQSLKAIVLDPRLGAEDRSIELSASFPEVQKLPCTPVRFRSCLYPHLGQFFREIGLRCHAGVRLGFPSTSFSTLRVGLDESGLRRLVKAKAAKVSGYRSGLAATPIWLVVHSDGFPLPASVPELHLPRAIGVVAEETSGSGFDAIFWYDSVLKHPSRGELTRIHTS